MIPLIRPDLPPVEAWLPIYERSLASGQLSNFGQAYREAARMLEAVTGLRATPVANGTLALQIALSAALNGPMHEILPRRPRVAVPDFTFVATAFAVLGAQCEPVIVPCDEKTLQPNPAVLREFAEELDAIVVTSPFGYAVNFELYDALADELGLPLVYDLAGAWGMALETQNLCAMSFHATKTLGIGEGGAVFGDNEHVEQLINFGFTEARVSRFARATNAKMDELHAAILCAQLQRTDVLEARIEKRKDFVRYYAAAVPNILSYREEWLTNGAPHLCTLKVDGDVEALVARLERAGIVARRGYYPLLSGHPAFADFSLLASSPPSLRQYVCLPSDVGIDGFELVVTTIRA